MLELVGLEVAGRTAGGKFGGAVGDEDVHELDGAQRNHAWPHEVDDFSNAGEFQIEDGAVAVVVFEEGGNLDEDVEEAADDCSPGEAVNAHCWDESVDADGVADVEADGGEGGEGEMLVGVEDAAEDAADAEDGGLDEDDAHEFGR